MTHSKGAVIDLHDEELHPGNAAAVGTLAGDEEAVAFHGQFEVFAAHAGDLDLHDKTVLANINIRVGIQCDCPPSSLRVTGNF